MRALRAVLLVVGLAAGAYGALLLLRLDPADLLDAGLWLVGGAVLHDAVVAPVTLLAALAARRVVPPDWRTPVTVGLLVLATVTVTAVPVLGRFGAREDNPTLLDRDYTTGWLVLLALVVALVLSLRVREGRRARAATGSDQDSDQDVEQQAD